MDREKLDRPPEKAQKEIRDLEERLAATRKEVDALKASMRKEVDALKTALPVARAEVAELRGLLAHTRKHFARLEQELDATRSRMDLDASTFLDLEAYRNSAAYEKIYGNPLPLVSVCVATYNRAALLTERCLPSLLAQDYANLEIIVVGDGCTDDTAERMAKIQDPRVRFVNRTSRQDLPANPYFRWMVAGADAGNQASAMAQGDLLTHLDDDDEYTPDRIRKLVDFLRETRAELVWHPFHREATPGQWDTVAAEDFRITQVTTGSTLYLSWFKRFPWDPQAYLYWEPGDWNFFRKVRYLGARLRRFPEPLLRHHREHARDA